MLAIATSLPLLLAVVAFGLSRWCGWRPWMMPPLFVGLVGAGAATAATVDGRLGTWAQIAAPLGLCACGAMLALAVCSADEAEDPAPVEADWWPSFERAFAAYVSERETRER
jgi:hypothetical protein